MNCPASNITTSSSLKIEGAKFVVHSDWDDAEETQHHYANCICGEEHYSLKFSALVSSLVRCAKRRKDR